MELPTGRRHAASLSGNRLALVTYYTGPSKLLNQNWFSLNKSLKFVHPSRNVSCSNDLNGLARPGLMWGITAPSPPDWPFSLRQQAKIYRLGVTGTVPPVQLTVASLSGSNDSDAEIPVTRRRPGILIAVRVRLVLVCGGLSCFISPAALLGSTR